MNIQENIVNFYTQANELNFNAVELFDKNPLGVVLFLILLLVTVLVPMFLYRLIKHAQANKVINKVLNASNVDDFDRYFIELLEQLDLNVNSFLIHRIYVQNEMIENKYLEFVDDVSIKKQIIYMKSLADKFNELALRDASTKGLIKIHYHERVHTLINNDLRMMIEKYCLQCGYWQDDIENIYAVVAYANTLENPNEILDTISKQLNRVDLANDISVMRFVLLLNKDKALQVYDFCMNQLNLVFEESKVIYTLILELVYHSAYVSLVYTYIENMEDKVWIEYLYSQYFAKTNDIKLDLAFIHNDLICNEDHCDFITCAVTDNWQDVHTLESICHNKHIVDILGHDETRKVISRTDELHYMEKESQAQAIANEALITAQNALLLVEEMKNS